jgi:primosomal protein N' (replication factor Y)
VATPGAEPVADGGYTAALLLDGWALLNRADLRAEEEALRRWLNAAALVRPAGSGGRVVVVADAALRPVQALLRWDPATFAERELADRQVLGFPPAVRMAGITGSREAVEDLLAATDLPATAQVLGPIPHGPADEVRALVRVPVLEAPRLAEALHQAQGVRSARKAPGSVRVRIDPVPLG